MTAKIACDKEILTTFMQYFDLNHVLMPLLGSSQVEHQNEGCSLAGKLFAGSHETTIAVHAATKPAVTCLLQLTSQLDTA
jgi:hypothetical protein